MARTDWPRIRRAIEESPGIDKASLSSALSLSIPVLTRDLPAMRAEGLIEIRRDEESRGPGKPRDLFFPTVNEVPPPPGQEANVVVSMTPEAAAPMPPDPAAHAGPGGNGSAAPDAAAPVGATPGAPRNFSPPVTARMDKQSAEELGREADQVMKVVRSVKGGQANALATVERIGPSELEEINETGVLDANVPLGEVEDPREFTRKKWGGGVYRWSMRLPSGQPIAGAVVVFRVAGDFIATSAAGRRHLLERREEERRLAPPPPYGYAPAPPPAKDPGSDPIVAFLREQASSSAELVRTMLASMAGARPAQGASIDPVQLQTMIDQRVTSAVADCDRRANERLADLKERHAEEIRRLEASHRLELKHVETNARMEEQAKTKGGTLQDKVLELPRVAESLADLMTRGMEKKMGLEEPEGPGDWSDVFKDLVSKVGQPALESFLDAAASKLRGAPAARQKGPSQVRALPGPTAAAPAASPPPASDGGATVGEPAAAAPAEGGDPKAAPPTSVQAAQAAAVVRVNGFLEGLEREYAVRSRPEGFWEIPAAPNVETTTGALWDALPGKVREPVEKAAEEAEGAGADPGAAGWGKFAELLAQHPAVVRMVQVAGQDPEGAEWLARVFASGPWTGEPEEEEPE